MANLHIAGTTEIDETGYNMTNLKNNMVYSTNEIDTGKKWIDGKPIYRKCFSGTITDNVVFENIGSFSKIISIDGNILSRYGQYWPIGRAVPEAGYTSQIWVNTVGQITISVNDFLKSEPFILTIEYTK